MYKPISKTHKNEVLTDNSKIKNCKQCKKCKFWGNKKNDAFSNTFDKSCCDKYPYPDHKPMVVINNTGQCIFRAVKE